MSERLRERAAAIPPLDDEAMSRAQMRLDQLTKPQGSLGLLEQQLIRLAGMTGYMIPSINRASGMIFAADHGVSQEGVSAYDAQVTEEMTVNMCMGGAVSSVLSRGLDCELQIVDVGISADVRHPGAVNRKVARGTRNFLQHRAMTQSQAQACVHSGIELADQRIDEGADVLVLGEMGIGNTTAAAAMTAALLNEPAEQLTGMGTGIRMEQRLQKVEVIEAALAKHQLSAASPWSVLEAVGGFEIGAMAGAMVAAASRRVPIVLDGMIAGAAALWAARFNQALGGYLIASHCSAEPAHTKILQALRLKPMVNWQLRLGEGSGALLMLPVLQQACRIMAETVTFADAGVRNPHPTGAEAEAERGRDFRAGDGHGHRAQRPAAADFSPHEQTAVYKAFAARRDIRSYLPDPIPQDVLMRILQAAHLAPSVGYMQPWNFILVSDKTVLKQLHLVVDRERIRAAEHYSDVQQSFYLRLKLEGILQAPLTICVTNDSGRGGPHVLGRNTIPETDLMSTACAIENMWLAARVEGIAMGWISMYQKPDIREILAMPETIDPAALLTLGYTAHFPDIPVLERAGWGERLDLETLVYYNRWKQANKKS